MRAGVDIACKEEMVVVARGEATISSGAGSAIVGDLDIGTRATPRPVRAKMVPQRRYDLFPRREKEEVEDGRAEWAVPRS